MKKVYLVIILLVVVAVYLTGRIVTSGTNSNNPSIKAAEQEIATLTPEQFSDLLKGGEYTLLDIRTADEYSSGHIRNAKQIDYNQTQQFSDYLDRLDKKAKYLIYCRTGKRSSSALQMMQEKGFMNVADLSGGINAWIAGGYPIEQ